MHWGSDMTENLWIKGIREYWSDPKNVIGPPGAMIRRMVRTAWLVVTVYLLFWVAGPSQVKSLQLWMSDDRLAYDIGWAFTFASALAFSVVSFAASDTEPFKLPIPWPHRIWPLNQWRWVHLHVANIRVSAGGAIVGLLLATQLYVMYNYYTHEQMMAGDASVVALTGSADRVSELEASLREGEERWSASDREAGAALAAAPAAYVTARSRIMRERTTAATAWRTERARLQNDLREARAASVTTRQTFTDPRPADGQLAAKFGVDRPVMAAIMDSIRSVVIEGLLVLGLGLAIHPSRRVAAGIVSRGKQSEDFVAETPEAPVDPAPPRPRPRFTLPTATETDEAMAAAIGPLTPATPDAGETAADDGEAAPEPAESEETMEPAPDTAAPEEPVDPLMAEALMHDQDETEQNNG
jgi:hypothetical protein